MAKGGSAFALRGTPVRAADLDPAHSLRLWEYGVGDTVRQSTFVNLRRVAAGEYELTGDVDVEVTLGGKTQRVTSAELAKSPVRVR